MNLLKIISDIIGKVYGKSGLMIRRKRLMTVRGMAIKR